MRPSAVSGALDAAGFDVPAHLEAAPPTLIEARALQQRIDRKYVIAGYHLERLLLGLTQGYCLVRAGQHAWARYESLYLDTPALDLYHAHRRGLRPRYKVRIRRHVDRHLAFLEIKCREHSGRTVKLRLDLPFDQTGIGARERQFVEAHTALDAAALVPAVSIAFQRLTLVGLHVNERFTLDRALAMSAGGRTERIPGAVIAEVKQARHGIRGGATPALRALHAREIAVSKYCLGTMLVTPVPAHVFLPALKALERFSN